MWCCMIIKCYPEGRLKAFNVTYDDGVCQDVRLVELLNPYGIRGTFNLNSQLMAEEFAWIHENGMTVRRLPPQTVRDLYAGHEVASHTLTHPYMDSLPEGEILRQMSEDKANLERLFERPVSGFAVPFTYYSPLIADCARRCGFSYARMSEERYTYAPPEDDYYWAAGTYHISPGFADFVNGFWETEEELALCQIVGHSYDLDTLQMWELMESLISRVAADKDTLPVTHLEAVRYWQAMQKAVIEEAYIFNGSDTVLWFEINGKVCSVSPGERLEIK